MSIAQPIRGASVDLTNPLARGLVGYWPMLEGTGNTLHDYSGRGNTGTLGSANTWHDGKVPAITGVDSAPNSGIALPATVDCGHYSSIAMWLRRTGLDANQMVAGEADYDFDFHIYLYSNSNWRYRIGAASIVEFVKVPPLNEWVHVAWVRDGTSVDMYWDGQFLGNATSNFGDTTQFDLFMAESDGSGSNPWLGEMGDIAAFSRCLSPSEVSQLYSDPWALFAPRTVVLPAVADVTGTNPYGSDSVSFNWTVNPA